MIKRILVLEIKPHTRTDSHIFNKCLRTVNTSGDNWWESFCISFNACVLNIKIRLKSLA
jgi:hypothetical protein